jgi:hypothetical protein
VRDAHDRDHAEALVDVLDLGRPAGGVVAALPVRVVERRQPAQLDAQPARRRRALRRLARQRVVGRDGAAQQSRPRGRRAQALQRGPGEARRRGEQALAVALGEVEGSGPG